MSSISLPRYVHRVVSRGREYFYFQIGRGTKNAGPRVPLPNDPQSVEFWQAIRQAQGLTTGIVDNSIGALIDAYITAWPSLQKPLKPKTQDQYRRYLANIRKAWGELPADSLRPKHVDALIRKIGAERPGAANNTLDAMRALCNWARGPVDLLQHDPTFGVKHFEKGEGHQPWTPEQVAYADKHFTGMIRRFFFLSRYTGQRIGDIVRLGFDDIDEGGFRLKQQKTYVEPWCPIFPELEAEMATWERRPGPFLLQETGKSAGKPFSPNQMWKVFDKTRAQHPMLEGTVPHGLRAHAVIRLRFSGYTALQISDMIGMSVEMVEHYSRHADRKTGGQAILEKERMRKSEGL